jgi:protein AATF/BFR2
VPQLRGDIALEGREYAGQRTSRKRFFGAEDGSSDEGTGVDDGSDGDQDAGAWSSEGDEDFSTEERGTGSEEDGEAEHRSDEDGGVEGGERRRLNGTGKNRDDEEAALEREYEAMQAAEAEVVAGLRERAAKERQKGAAVAAQTNAWRRSLELRILLQRVLLGANRLPGPETRAVAVQEGVAPDAELSLAEAYAEVASEAAGLVKDLSELFTGTMARNPGVAAARAAATAASDGGVGVAAGGKHKRLGQDGGSGSMCDITWEEMEANYGLFKAFRDTSIDRWHRKTVLTGTALREGLKALNQSASSQVATLMRDPGRVVERTRLLTGQAKRLCVVKVSVGFLGGVVGAGSFTCSEEILECEVGRQVPSYSMLTLPGWDAQLWLPAHGA